MAYPVEVTLSTGNKVSLNYQSQEVAVTITYQLERSDTNVLTVVQEKTSELIAAHVLAWKGVKGEADRVQATNATVEDAGKTECGQEALASPRSSTPAQVSLIEALCRQRGTQQEDLSQHLQTAYGCDSVEDLSYDQAAAWLVALGQEERERFDHERERPFNS